LALNPKVFVKRALTTVLGIALIGGIVLFAPKIYFVLLMIMFTVLGAYEIKKIAEGFGSSFFLAPVLFCLLIGFLSFYMPFHIGIFPFASFLVCSLWILFAVKNQRQAFTSLGSHLTGLAYLAAAFFSLIGIFLLESVHSHTSGRDLLVFFFAIVWCGDSFAYLIGSTLGKHKIAPRISPKKSWEGTIGNLLGNFCAVWIGKTYFFTFLGTKDVIALALMIFILGFLGDLIESSWKRGAGIKDSGSIFPGHGGILDRIDSIFLTGPLFYSYFHFMFHVG